MSFRSDLKKSAQSYLYIFISKDAKMGKDIMTKRANQIARLRQIDDLPFTPNINELVLIVREGIKEQYGIEPEEVLSHIYNVAIQTNKVSGIGSFDANGNYVPDTKGSITATQNYNPMTGKPYTSVTEVAFKKVGEDKAKSTIWNDIAGVVEWIVKLFNSLGITSGPKDNVTIPASGEWSTLAYDNGGSSASMGGSVPYIVGGVILYYLFTTASANTKTKK